MVRYENVSHKIQKTWDQNQANQNTLDATITPVVENITIRGKKQFRFRLNDLSLVTFTQEDFDILQ